MACSTTLIGRRWADFHVSRCPFRERYRNRVLSSRSVVKKLCSGIASVISSLFDRSADADLHGDREPPVVLPSSCPRSRPRGPQTGRRVHLGDEIDREHSKVRQELVGVKPPEGSFPSPLFFSVLIRFSHLSPAWFWVLGNTTL